VREGYGYVGSRICDPESASDCTIPGRLNFGCALKHCCRDSVHQNDERLAFELHTSEPLAWRACHRTEAPHQCSDPKSHASFRVPGEFHDRRRFQPRPAIASPLILAKIFNAENAGFLQTCISMNWSVVVGINIKLRKCSMIGVRRLHTWRHLFTPSAGILSDATPQRRPVSFR